MGYSPEGRKELDTAKQLNMHACSNSEVLNPGCILESPRELLKRWEYQATWPASWEICMQVRKQQLELDMEQQTGSKSVKSMLRPYITILLL